MLPVPSWLLLAGSRIRPSLQSHTGMQKHCEIGNMALRLLEASVFKKL